MTIHQQKDGAVLTVAPVGRLDSATSGEFQAALEESFTEDTERLVLDFSGVDFISSKGLRVLFSAYKNLNGRSMEIVRANESVQEVFRLSGLLGIFQIG